MLVKQHWGDLNSLCQDRGDDRRRVKPVIFEGNLPPFIPREVVAAPRWADGTGVLDSFRIRISPLILACECDFAINTRMFLGFRH